MNFQYLLAQTSPSTPTVWQIFGILGGSSLLTGVAVLIARGYWAKTVTPLIETEIRRWYSSPEQVEARAKERQATFREWYDKRENVEEREKEMQHVLRNPSVVSETTQSVRLVIDNEIKRSDGLIHKEIKTQVDSMESRVISKLEEMAQLQREDTALKQKILQEMGQLKGAINAITGHGVGSSTVSPPPIPERVKAR
jgi:hypothetical protein